MGVSLFPSEENEDPDEAPEWVLEAWDWLLRKELKLAARKPA